MNNLPGKILLKSKIIIIDFLKKLFLFFGVKLYIMRSIKLRFKKTTFKSFDMKYSNYGVFTGPFT